MKDPTQRFSDRVDDYIKYRPSYPPEFMSLLSHTCRLASGSAIADVGSGTGILTSLLLGTGYRVFGVEPNRPMREAAERWLADSSGFVSIDGRAEATALPDRCVDAVIVAQAFHWFDRRAARIEFERILRTDGWVIIVWNDRRTDSSPFLQAYESLLRRYAEDYDVVRHTNVSAEELEKFFRPGRLGSAVFANHQHFDLEGLRGRLLSSSYAPREDKPGHAPMMAELERIFDAHQTSGRVTFEYDTRVYYGQLKPASAT